MHYYDAELADFLTARITEDYDLATKTQGDQSWDVDPTSKFFGEVVSSDGAIASSADIDDARHIARWDPARVLGDVAARQSIVDGYRSAGLKLAQEPMSSPERAAMAVLGRVCLQLAQPHAEHPEFANRWRSL